MNVSTSSSSSSSPSALSIPDASPSKRNLAFLRPVLSCGGALLTGAVLVHFVAPPKVAGQTPTNSTPTEMVALPITLSSSELVPVRAISPEVGGRTMRGQWKLTTNVTGRAPAGGQVARWVVEPGTQVAAGESVVEISTGVSVRPAPRAELQQNQAEKEQVAATNGQTKLAQRLTIAQTQLVAAQERVTDAQEKVAAARTLVKRLLAGEKIPAPRGSRRAKPVRVARETPEGPRLNREQRRAQDAADTARNRVSEAKNELDEAKKALVKAQKQFDAATAALAKVEADFKVEKTTADVLQNARADVDDSQSALKAAQTRVDVAESAYSTRQAKARTTEDVAESARRDAAQKTPSVQAEAPTPTSEDADQYMTADQAATLVAAALRESKAATRQAERIHARVDDYQRQVKETSQRVESASKNLQETQELVMESVPRASFTAARAPVSGTVTWISSLAREVSTGQSVFGISQGKNGFLRFEDKTGAWKSLKVGQTLNAASAPSDTSTTPPTTSPSADTSIGGSPPKPVSSSPAMPSSTTSTKVRPAIAPLSPPPTFSLRITRIAPPEKEGEAAQIDAVRTDGSAPSMDGANEVQAELPAGVLPVVTPDTARSSKPQALVIPLSVVLPRDGSSYVAVVVPGEGGQDQESQPLMLQWRSVKIERETAFDVEIKSGLRQGEQVVAQPVLLLSQLRPEEKKSLPVVIDAVD